MQFNLACPKTQRVFYIGIFFCIYEYVKQLNSTNYHSDLLNLQGNFPLGSSLENNTVSEKVTTSQL